jgi:hypothetical protein
VTASSPVPPQRRGTPYSTAEAQQEAHPLPSCLDINNPNAIPGTLLAQSRCLYRGASLPPGFVPSARESPLLSDA